MVTAMQVALPLAALLLVAGGSLVAWVVIFRRAGREERGDQHSPNAL
jgi:hypothetical protein